MGRLLEILKQVKSGMGGAAAKREIFSNHCGFQDSLPLVCCKVSDPEQGVVSEASRPTTREQVKNGITQTEPTSTKHNSVSTNISPNPKISRSTIPSVRFKNINTIRTSLTPSPRTTTKPSTSRPIIDKAEGFTVSNEVNERQGEGKVPWTTQTTTKTTRTTTTTTTTSSSTT